MKALVRLIDRFCYKRPRFGIPNLIRYIVFITALVWALGLMDTNNLLYPFLQFSPTAILQGQVWRLFTFVFVLMRWNPIFTVFWLYVSFIFGTSLERAWGTAKFTIFFLLSVVVLAAIGMLAYFLLPWHLGASVFLFVDGTYIHIFMFLIFATFRSDAPFRLFFIIPVRGLWAGLVVLGVTIFILFFQFRFFFPANLIPLSLFFVYFLFTWDIWGQRLSLRSRQRSGTVVNFKRAAKKVKKQQKNKPYSRKCAVCGKTDTDYPDLEFRYCSRCNGYHCFCIDHINNHVHFQ